MCVGGGHHWYVGIIRLHKGVISSDEPSYMYTRGGGKSCMSV